MHGCSLSLHRAWVQVCSLALALRRRGSPVRELDLEANIAADAAMQELRRPDCVQIAPRLRPDCAQMHRMHRMHTAHRTMHTTHRTTHNAQRTAHNAQRTAHNAHRPTQELLSCMSLSVLHCPVCLSLQELLRLCAASDSLVTLRCGANAVGPAGGAAVAAHLLGHPDGPLASLNVSNNPLGQAAVLIRRPCLGGRGRA